MAPGNKSSAGPPHSQLDAAGFNLSLPPPLGGTLPDPTIASAVSMFPMPCPECNDAALSLGSSHCGPASYLIISAWLP